MDLKTKAFDFEGVHYVIRRLRHKENSQVLEFNRKGDVDKAATLMLSFGLVEPKLTEAEIEEYDETHLAVISQELNAFLMPTRPENGSAKPS